MRYLFISILVTSAVSLLAYIYPGDTDNAVSVHSIYQSDTTILHKNYTTPLDQLISKSNSFSILIDKSDYTLSIISGDTIVKTYPVVLGDSPVNDKRCEGDMCTPEGTFKIRAKYPHKSWNKFLWVNYPTQDSWSKHNEAKQNGDIPRDATIGGEIGIHGVPEGMDDMIDRRRNWTFGCVSLKNKDVDEIYDYIIVNKTEIVIRR